MKKLIRVGWLDSLRGIAAIMVFILHGYLRVKNEFGIHYFNDFLSFWIFGFLDFGKIGVSVFFILSGYVIPTSLVYSNLHRFVISRVFRLYPIYWVSIIVFIIFFPVLDWRNVLVNLTMFHKFFGFEDLIGVFWTLQIELIFYILCIVLFYFDLLYKRSNVWLVYFLIFVAILFSYFRFSSGLKLPIGLFLGLALMLIGMLYRLYEQTNDIFLYKRLKFLVFSFILSLVPISLLAYNRDYGNMETWYRYFNSYVLTLLIFFIFRKYKLHSKSLIYLGRISYSFYLIHILVLDYLLGRIGGSLGYVLFSFIITVVVSTITYFLIEKPFVGYGKLVVKKLGYE